jgi:hypothetical protein
LKVHRQSVSLYATQQEAIPVYWLVLNKQGNSSQRERITLLPRFIGRFGRRGILGILGDREFIGDQGAMAQRPEHSLSDPDEGKPVADGAPRP